MLTLGVASATVSVPPVWLPLSTKLGAWIVLKSISRKSMPSPGLLAMPAPVPVKLAELSSFSVPVVDWNAMAALDALASSSVAPAAMFDDDEPVTANAELQALHAVPSLT